MRKLRIGWILLAGIFLILAGSDSFAAGKSKVPKMKSHFALVQNVIYTNRIDLDADKNLELVAVVERKRTGTLQLWILDKDGVLSQVDLGLPNSEFKFLDVEFADLIGLGMSQIYLKSSHIVQQGSKKVFSKNLSIFAFTHKGKKPVKVFDQRVEVLEKDEVTKRGIHKVWNVLFSTSTPMDILLVQVRNMLLPDQGNSPHQAEKERKFFWDAGEFRFRE